METQQCFELGEAQRSDGMRGSGALRKALSTVAAEGISKRKRGGISVPAPQASSCRNQP